MDDRLSFCNHDAHRWFFEWFDGVASGYVTREGKIRREKFLSIYLNELGGLGSSW